MPGGVGGKGPGCPEAAQHSIGPGPAWESGLHLGSDVQRWDSSVSSPGVGSSQSAKGEVWRREKYLDGKLGHKGRDSIGRAF